MYYILIDLFLAVLNFTLYLIFKNPFSLWVSGFIFGVAVAMIMNDIFLKMTKNKTL